MSNRRKDMWKLLYDLVGRSGTDLNDVFASVDEILCREPSLIRTSLREVNNRFQDTFVLWLINKFVRSLGDKHAEEIHRQNIKLQQKILSSCLVNRPSLFEHLVEVYVSAIDQLSKELLELDERNVAGAVATEAEYTLEVNAFTSDDLCLREIDAGFTFQIVHVRLDEVDERVQALLHVLRYALSIGYALYPKLFVSSLFCALKALKECDFRTKLLCLRYCNALYRVVLEWCPQLEHYYKLNMQALVLMWEQVPMWLYAQCMQPEDLDGLVDVSVVLLDSLKRFHEQLQCEDELFQLALNMLHTIMEMQQVPQQKCHITKYQTVASSTIDFMLELQLHTRKGVMLGKQQALLLIRLVEQQATLLRLLATIVALQDTHLCTKLLKYFKQRILDLCRSTSLLKEDLERLQEYLAALAFVEHQQRQRKQFDYLERTQQVPSAEQLENCIHLFEKIEDDKWTSELNAAIERFILHAQQNKEFEQNVAIVKIAGLLLSTTTLRFVIKAQMQQKLIDIIERPLKLVLETYQVKNTDEREMAHIVLQILCSICLEKSAAGFSYLKHVIENIANKLFSRKSLPSESLNELRNAFCDHLDVLVVLGLLKGSKVLNEFVCSAVHDTRMLACMLKSVYCTSDATNCRVFMQLNYVATGRRQMQEHALQKLHIVCLNCSTCCKTTEELAAYMREKNAVLIKWNSTSKQHTPTLPATIQQALCQALFKDASFLPIANHLKLSKINASDCLQVISSTADLSTLNLIILHKLMPKFAADNEDFLMEMAQHILQRIEESLGLLQEQPNRRQQQLQLLELITCCAHSDINEIWLFHFFKLTFFFLMHPQSEVVQEAVLCATEMCAKHSLQPACLWNWYKRDALGLIVKLAVYVFLHNGVRLTRSLKAFTKMLGFSCVQEFICRYYRLLTTMILPYCVKESKCKGLIVNISKVTRKPISMLFVVSFLRIYTHIYLTEEADIGNKCIELIVRCTDFSLKKLMNTDVKQTVSELLVYFNRNPQFVMKAFQLLLFNENNSGNVKRTTSSNSSPSLNTSTGDFAKFIADRFLGVITYFETCLAEPTFEKPLKEEALYSLGQIIRFVGAHHVTQFRFKIIAMLSFVLSLNDRHLQSICLKIWNIFLHIVNIQELGPSLSRIVASLQPLLAHSESEVNAIYEFIILKNDSLLGAYIPDLYFVENIERVAPAIRQCVARQTEILKSDKSTLLDKVGFLYKQISNENLQVRIYGLLYLRRFIANHRADINRMILSEIRVNPLIENVMDILMAGCRHEDRNLQLASAKCLGELGAIDPSYMSFNYSFEQTGDLPLSVHTDDFAIMALTELCRAYQFQKDTKYVDNFSLAIQETLSVCGVSPKEQKKMNVWEAVPARMRQVMEPLLTSCYTASRRESNCTEHPIFNSSFCRSYEDWAFTWTSRLIDLVQTEDTKHLLYSYKPSIKRDNNMLAIFFPYILLHALQEGNDAQIQQMYEEFEAVFGFSSRGIVAQPEYETDGVKEFISIKYAADLSGTDAERRGVLEQREALENITRTCTKLCSEQVDFLKRWLCEWQRHNIVGGKVNESDKNYKRVQGFLANFDKLVVAKANYHSGEFTRALRYVEEYIEEDIKQRLQEQISFLIKIYGELMDADSVEGAVYMNKSNLTLAEEIMVNRIVDRPQEMMTYYEQLMSSDESISQDDVKGMINCYLRMDTPETALLITDGLWQKLTEQYTDDYFKECKSELLVRLGRYDELQELLEDSVVRRKTTNWNIQCAEAFLLFRQPAQKEVSSTFVEQLDNIWRNVLSTMRTCSGIKQNSYPHSYDEVIKLHLLNEVEKNKEMVNCVTTHLLSQADDVDSKCLEEVRLFFTNWDDRLCVLQPVVRVIEPIFSFRRNLLIETKRLLPHSVDIGESKLLKEVIEIVDSEIGKLWLRSVQMNREAGSLQQAHLSIMKAEQYAPKTLFIEKAKLLWEKGDQTKTFKLLEENLEKIEAKCGRNISALKSSDRALYGEAKYLQATYNAESMNICSELNLQYFKEAIQCNRHSEKCHVQLAQYMEKIFASFSTDQKDGDSGRKLLLEIMINYAKSLKCGYDNVYQSLPRLLSIWLDFTSQCASVCDSATSDNTLAHKANGMQELATKMNELMINCSNVLPTSIFYTAFSQLLSRICHPSTEVFNVLRTIVIKLIEQFPQQSLWMLLPIFKSSQTNRMKRCKLIFTDSRLSKSQFQKLLNDFNMLAERLIELTNKDVDRAHELSMLVKQLPKLFEDPKFSNILLPFEKYMQPSFPIASSSATWNLNLSQGSQENANKSTASIPTNPFPYKQIYICGIREEVTVLRSAAKPKKITIHCSDGKDYDVMVKPKDDLRKDFRLMEFNGLVKRYLHQDSQARHRHLRIRTYAAIPFNEECGLVEWLPNLNSFRRICTSIYRMRGLGLNDRMLRQCALPKTDPIEKKRNVFLKTLLPSHPPVFQEWLRHRFPTPNSWYEARCSFVKTVAVMSMVGYILGLGDRHGENLLFDETNGDAVHVDFNCLFNQGELFAYPELVPFRLTHNMVFAMGPLGVEGMYRKCCEITLRVLKQQSKTLMSVLRPFVYDLVALNRNYNKKQLSAELTDPKALMDVRRIEERLQGYVKRTLANSMPLSTEGQVSFLIAEATDIDNLAAMYIGWGSYI